VADARTADGGERNPAGGVLVVYHRPAHRWFKDAATVREHIHSFRRYSRFPVWEINTDLGFPEGLREIEPSAVLLHYSMFGSGHYLLGDEMERWLKRSSALKIAFFQDEFYFCQKRFRLVNNLGVDIVQTHVSPQYIPQVWGTYTPKARAVFNLPGYVDEGMLDAARRYATPDADRDLDVGYRGRPLPPHMGAGSQEKRVIGERFKELARATSLRVDIETAESARLYGKAWYEFLGRCKATLGVESGVSFMDLEDECHAEYVRLRAAGIEPTLEQLQAGALGRWDGNIPYRTIGPRHFEAAAFRICQVLFEGEYSGVMEPMVHYVPLKEDFSNFDEVVSHLQDDALRRRITDRAYEDLIASGRFSYASFVRDLDGELLNAGLDPDVPGDVVRDVTVKLQRGALRRRVRKDVRGALGRLHYYVWRVVAPLSLRVRRALGLPLPPG
jgi:hypothetical protein